MTPPAREGSGSDGAPERLHELGERFTRPNWNETAITDDGRSMKGAQFAGALDEATTALRNAGVTSGDRILLINENSISGALAILAASRTGAWVAPVNARHTAAELDAISEHYAPHLTLYTVEASGPAARHAERNGATPLAFGGADAVHALKGDGCAADCDPDARAGDVSVVIYTSGTTGTPKGVMLTHANLIFNARVAGALRRFVHDDYLYGLLPISHVFGLGSVLLAAFYYGTRIRLAARFDADAVARAFAQEGVSLLNGVPTVYTRMVEYAAAHGGVLKAPKLRYISTGGGPLDPTLKQKTEALLGIPLNNGYGLTESSPSAMMTRLEDPQEDTTVGPVVPEVEAKIVDPEVLRDLPDGEIGEIWMRGPNIMKGYFRDRALTAATLVEDGWLRTGDLGQRAPNGNFYIVDRRKEVIIHSGFNVYPAEVEAALKTHPEIMQCCVVGASARGNEEIIAFVETGGREIAISSLRAHMRKLLSPYKQPTRYVFLDQLPTGPTGKILRVALTSRGRAMMQEEEAQTSESR